MSKISPSYRRVHSPTFKSKILNPIIWWEITFICGRQLHNFDTLVQFELASLITKYYKNAYAFESTIDWQPCLNEGFAKDGELKQDLAT